MHASCTVAIDGEIENARYRIVEQSDSVDPLLVIASDVVVRFPVVTITPEAPLLLMFPYVSTFEALTDHAPVVLH